MLECLLVVAMVVQGDTAARSFSTMKNVPEAGAAQIMAIEAGRANAHHAGLWRYPKGAESLYGYDCGDGWIDRGLARSDVFSR